MKSNLLFLDTETTGIANGRLIQLAYKRRDDKDITVEYFKPPVPIEIEAMAVHHITEKKVADKMPFEKSEGYRALEILLAGSVFVAHNAKFDIGILENEGLSVGQSICTMKVAQTLYDYPNYKMQYLRYLWGIEIDEAVAHDAAGDVAVLEKVFDHMLQDYSAANGATEEATISTFITFSNNPILLRRANFGKYVGKTFKEIKTNDPSYFQWMATIKDKGEDYDYTMKYYMNDAEAA